MHETELIAWQELLDSGKPRRIRVGCKLTFSNLTKYYATGPVSIVEAGSNIYASGTVDVTQGSKTVSRTAGGSAFSSTIVKVGSIFRTRGGDFYTIDSVAGDLLSFTLDKSYQGDTATGAEFNVVYDFSRVRFVPALRVTNYPESSIDLEAKSSEISSMGLEIAGTLRLQDLSANNVILPNGVAEVRLIHEGLLWEDGFILMRGAVRDIQWSTDDVPFGFRIVESRLTKDKRFPPNKITSDNFPDAPEQSVGNAYPILYGSFVESPTYFVGLIDGNNRFVVAGHNVTSITQAYHEGIAFTHANEGLAVDGDGNAYYYIDTPFAITDEAITVTGTAPITSLGDMIVDMVLNYSDLPSREIDLAGLDGVANALSGYIASSIFNGSGNNSATVFESLQNRIAQQFPIIPAVTGGEYGFLTLPLDNPIIEDRLFYGQNIIRRESLVTETDIDKVFNSFELQYAFNARLNEYTKTKKLNKDNSEVLRDSEEKYGLREETTITAPDITDDSMAIALLRFYELYFSGVFKIIRYLCTLDASHIFEGNFVQVTDTNLGWSSKNFIVISRQLRKDSISLTLRESPI